MTDLTGIEAGVQVASGVAVAVLKSVGSGGRYAILIISLALLPVACGEGDEQPAATLSPSQAATSPTTNPTATYPPTSTETTPQTLLVLGGDEGRVDAPPGVYLVELDGKNLRRIGDRRYDARLELGEDPGKVIIDGVSYLTGVIGWAPGGARLVFYACPSNPITADGRLYAVNADGSGLTRVSNPPGGSPVVCYSEGVPAVAWSPDGAKLVYYSYTEPYGLYIANADGTGTRFLTAGGAPQWSPQGNTILFVRRPDAAAEADWKVPIYTIDSDGTRESELVRVPLDCTGWALFGCVAPHPYWSPDGGLLAFTAVGGPVDFPQLEGSPISDVFVIGANGSGLTKIEGLPKSAPPGGGSHFAGWVNCAGPLPTAGCQVRLTNVGAQGLNMRREPGIDQEAIGLLSEGAIACMLGSPALIRGLQWWPVRSSDGAEGWAAVFDPGDPRTTWLEATGAAC